VLRRLRLQATRLVTFRDYLETSRALLPPAPLPLPLARFAVDEDGVPLPLPSAAREPITLHTSNGTRFAAFLDPQGHGQVVALHGSFPDRTQLSLDLAKGVVSCVLPDGRAPLFTLQQCMDAANSDDLEDVPSLRSSSSSSPFPSSFSAAASGSVAGTAQANAAGPSAVTGLHTRALLAFLRWARTPPHQRLDLVAQDKHISRVAQAAALQNQRHVLVLGMQSRAVPRTKAEVMTQTLRDRLVFCGRESALALPPPPPSATATAAAPASGQRVSDASSVRVDPRLARAVHNSEVRQLAKKQLEACQAFVSRGIVE
jgi:hypothetical protein